MKENNPLLTKTCASCGQQKPLSAFLQVTGPEGASYGNICSSCRKTQMEAPKTKEEETTTSYTGFKIDSKVKVKIESDLKQMKQEVEEQYHEDRDKDAQIDLNLSQKKENTTKQQKKHHESFLGKKSFLQQKKQNKSSIIPGSVEEVTQREQQMDFQSPVIDTQIAGKRKFVESATFNAFQTWLPEGSPIAKKAKQAQKAAEKRNEKEPTDPEDYLKKTFGRKK